MVLWCQETPTGTPLLAGLTFKAWLWQAWLHGFLLPLPSNRCRWSLADIWSFVDTMELESQGLHSLFMNFRCASQGIPLFRHSMNMVGNSCCLSWFCLLALFLLNCGLLCFNILWIQKKISLFFYWLNYEVFNLPLLGRPVAYSLDLIAEHQLEMIAGYQNGSRWSVTLLMSRQKVLSPVQMLVQVDFMAGYSFAKCYDLQFPLDANRCDVTNRETSQVMFTTCHRDRSTSWEHFQCLPQV